MKFKLLRCIKYIKSNYWRFTPDSWINWFYYWKSEINHKIDIWKVWGVLPWQNNSHCSVCAGSKQSKYGDECDHCGGKGYTSRWNETKMSKMFKFCGIRFNNKPEKL